MDSGGENVDGSTSGTDGGATTDLDATTRDGSDSSIGEFPNTVGPLCVPDDTRTAALASDPFCEDCFCVECLESQAGTPGGSTLKMNRPDNTCSTDNSASMLAFRLQGDRLRVIEANPLRKLLMVRERTATIFAGVTQKAAGPGLTDAEVVAALAAMRNAEQEMITLRTVVRDARSVRRLLLSSRGLHRRPRLRRQRRRDLRSM